MFGAFDDESEPSGDVAWILDPVFVIAGDCPQAPRLIQHILNGSYNPDIPVAFQSKDFEFGCFVQEFENQCRSQGWDVVKFRAHYAAAKATVESFPLALSEAFALRCMTVLEPKVCVKMNQALFAACSGEADFLRGWHAFLHGLIQGHMKLAKRASKPSQLSRGLWMSQSSVAQLTNGAQVVIPGFLPAFVHEDVAAAALPMGNPNHSAGAAAPWIPVLFVMGEDVCKEAASVEGLTENPGEEVWTFRPFLRVCVAHIDEIDVQMLGKVRRVHVRCEAGFPALPAVLHAPIHAVLETALMLALHSEVTDPENGASCLTGTGSSKLLMRQLANLEEDLFHAREAFVDVMFSHPVLRKLSNMAINGVGSLMLLIALPVSAFRGATEGRHDLLRQHMQALGSSFVSAVGMNDSDDMEQDREQLLTSRGVPKPITKGFSQLAAEVDSLRLRSLAVNEGELGNFMEAYLARLKGGPFDPLRVVTDFAVQFAQSNGTGEQESRIVMWLAFKHYCFLVQEICQEQVKSSSQILEDFRKWDEQLAVEMNSVVGDVFPAEVDVDHVCTTYIPLLRQCYAAAVPSAEPGAWEAAVAIDAAGPPRWAEWLAGTRKDQLSPVACAAAQRVVTRLHEVRTTLAQHRVVLVMGSPDAGKSQFLNSVFGIQTCPGQYVATERLRVYPHPDAPAGYNALLCDVPGIGDNLEARADAVRLASRAVGLCQGQPDRGMVVVVWLLNAEALRYDVPDHDELFRHVLEHVPLQNRLIVVTKTDCFFGKKWQEVPADAKREWKKNAGLREQYFTQVVHQCRASLDEECRRHGVSAQELVYTSLVPETEDDEDVPKWKQELPTRFPLTSIDELRTRVNHLLGFTGCCQSASPPGQMQTSDAEVAD
mmetsp:Transcript_135079/g.305806  ORF Transcript_135079/g.305806 Transcript_135079/m.305806 type:complete len:882 (+) Transcript_135079:22-2667(+)